MAGKPLAVLLLLASCAVGARAESEADLRVFLAGLAQRVDLSNAYISVVDLRDPATPLRAGYRDEESVYPASVIKLALLSQAYNLQATEGLDFATWIRIRKDNMTGTWPAPGDSYPPIRAGQDWMLADLLQVMIRRSDNVATNTLIDFLDRAKTTRHMAEIGCPATAVRRKVYAGYDVPNPGTGRNSMPPKDAATLLMRIAMRSLVSASASDAMHAVLLGQLDRDYIAAGIGKDSVYAGKTGGTDETTHDAAIVDGPTGRYVLVVYTRLPDTQGKKVIRKVASAVDAYFRDVPR